MPYSTTFHRQLIGAAELDRLIAIAGRAVEGRATEPEADAMLAALPDALAELRNYRRMLADLYGDWMGLEPDNVVAFPAPLTRREGPTPANDGGTAA